MSVLESGKLPLKPVHFIPQCLDLERCHSISLSRCSWCLNCFHYFPLQWQNITIHHKTWEDTGPCEPSKSFQVSTKSSLDVEAASPDRWGGLSRPASGPSGPSGPVGWWQCPCRRRRWIGIALHGVVRCWGLDMTARRRDKRGMCEDVCLQSLSLCLYWFEMVN